MRRVVLRVRADALEDVLDALLPRLPDGVHERAAAPGAVELLAHALSGPLPPREELVALAGPGLLSLDERDVPADWQERRRLDGGGGVAIGGRVWLRSPLDPPPAPGLLDVVIERSTAFGTGAHPTTRMCLALLAEIDPTGGFADLGCGAGALAITAALLGFEPVVAVDRDEPSVRSARANARRNGVELRATVLDLLAEPAPPARVVAANVPAAVHARVAELLPEGVEHLIASGIRPDARDAMLAAYATAGLRCTEEREEGGWLALALKRDAGGEPARPPPRRSPRRPPRPPRRPRSPRRQRSRGMADLPGQLSTPLHGGGLALSHSKPIEEGARAALLLAPDLFRLDVTPLEDTLRIQVRNLSAGSCEWADGGQPLVVLAFDGPAISAHTLRVDVDGRRADVLFSATRETEDGRMRFVAQAVVSARSTT